MGLKYNTLEVKADSLTKIVSEETELQDKYIDYLCTLFINNTEYMDSFFNANRDTVIKSKGTIFKIDDIKYQIMNSVKTTGVDRPSGYFMPDSLYSVSYDIKTIMQYRYYKDRGGYQRFFDSYNENTKQALVFCEAILYYTGEKMENVDNFMRAYEMFICGHTENIGDALILNDINDVIRIELIQHIFELEHELTKYNSLEQFKDTYEMPYLLGYDSRENLLEASFSLVGKVRYTWAGGHALASTIRGINPVWEKWNTLYENNGTCIKPSGSWCPVHGYNEDDRCITYDILTEYNDYLKLRADTLQDETLLSDKYTNMLDSIDSEDGTAHRLDGLDCSGYTSWVLNQIQNKYSIDSTAMYFTKQDGINSIEFGKELLPGDIFAWTSHIVVIVGKVSDNSKVYVTVEQTPNVLKFGTVYYAGYKEADLSKAMQIAREANQLIGAVDEEPHSYCMNNVGHYSVDLEDGQNISDLLGNVTSIETKEVTVDDNVVDDENDDLSGESTQTVTTVKAQYIDIGRYSESFKDESKLVGSYETSIESMTASDIISYIITKMPIQYINGYNTYNGSIFDKNTVSTSVGTTLFKE